MSKKYSAPARKTGSQVPPEVLGVRVGLVGGLLITKRDAQRVLQLKLNVTDRQARATISSYQAENWLEPAARCTAGGRATLKINAPIAQVSSFTNRVLDHVDRRAEASRENGLLGGRPRCR